MRILLISVAALALVACGKDTALLQNGPPDTVTSGNPPSDGGVADGGSPVKTCASDCDCGTGSRCAPASGEAPAQCVAGTNTCPVQCMPACGANQVCDMQTGTCDQLHCPSQVTCGANQYCDANGICQANATELSVDGVWNTSYTVDVHQFAQTEGTVLVILNLLDALLTGQASCSGSSPTEQLLCFIFDLVGAQVMAPPWVNQLLQTLEDLFKFGSSPVVAVGQMTLTQGSNQALAGTETWSSLLVNYNGSQLDLMNSPVLGSNGNVTVTVHPFTGTRDPGNVYLGPRSVDLDVNHFIIALADVAIDAATNGQATDIASLLDLAICNPLPNATELIACYAAASSLASSITASSGLGGFDISNQSAPVLDPNNTGRATNLALPSAPAALVGSMSNGVVSGNFGPTSSWYGTR